jgi:hypothetical protein
VSGCLQKVSFGCRKDGERWRPPGIISLQYKYCQDCQHQLIPEIHPAFPMQLFWVICKLQFAMKT